jgi:hypothetical protein
MTGSHEVRGSIPLGSTNPINSRATRVLFSSCELINFPLANISELATKDSQNKRRYEAAPLIDTLMLPISIQIARQIAQYP